MTTGIGMLECVLQGLEGSKGDWPKIAEASGVPYQTITKIAGGFVRDPRVSTVQALHDYFAHCANEHSMPSNAPPAN